MKTWNDLTEEQQNQAVKQRLEYHLKVVLNGMLRFNDELNEDDFQARIDKAIQEAEDMQTPWFAHEYLLQDEVIKQKLEGMSRADCEDALYPEPGELIIHLSL